MNRQFAQTDEHTAHIVQEYNRAIGPQDLVFVIGDVIYNKADPRRYLAVIGKMHGTKILVRGNHDENISDRDFQTVFAKIIPQDEGIGIDLQYPDGTQEVYLTHYPTGGKEGMMNLVGHVHGKWQVYYQPESNTRYLNVGIDAHHYRPISLDTIPQWDATITKYSDRDVFPHNMKAGSYADKLRKQR